MKKLTREQQALLEEIKLEEELLRRQQVEEYRTDYKKFAKDKLKIKNKDSVWQPLDFLETQQIVHEAIEGQLAETGKIRAIILKGRQHMISTYCTGRIFWKSYFEQDTSSVIMAHDADTSSALFDMSKAIIDKMEDGWAPVRSKSSAKEIIINSPAHKDKESGSAYKLYTAGSPEAGRGTTPRQAHLSEVAFWPHDDKILAGLFQGIPDVEGTSVILESTANGAQGEFYRLWKDAVAGKNEFIAIFIAWFKMKEYAKPVTTVASDNLTEEEENLISEYDLSYEQLQWRRWRISLIGPIKFKQEYPATADEAFLISGYNVFDAEAIQELEGQVAKPTSVMQYMGDKNMFEAVPRGPLEIWGHGSYEQEFILGADVAGGAGKDFSTAVVMTPDNKVVALYRDNTIDPGTFGDLLFYLGRMYNNCLIVCESNNHGSATLHQLQKMQYANLYYDKPLVNITDTTARPGFRTTALTKPQLITGLQRTLLERKITIPSTIILDEMMDYIADDKGRTNARHGKHDDTVIATALCLEGLRTHSHQLSAKPKWNNNPAFSFQDETHWL